MCTVSIIMRETRTVDVQSHPPLVDGAHEYARANKEADEPRLPATVGFLFDSFAERKIECGGICYFIPWRSNNMFMPSESVQRWFAI